jgi:uncharacterized membrane protein YphA (DoxX/SURF4 family)
MPYRVDYLVGLLVTGALGGWLLGRRPAGAAARAARGYLVLSLVTVSARVAATFGYAIFGFTPAAITAWAVARDAGNVVVGALFGLALRERRVLREADVLRALCVSTGIWFVVGGLVSAFAIEGMTQFFVQSGYAAPFLKLIITVEIVGGVALLLPWAVPVGLIMLAVDMLGALYTHARNGDGIDADMDALAVLVRLGAIAALWLLSSRPALARRRVLAMIAAGAVLCLATAVAGSHVVRYLSAPALAGAVH